MRKIQQILLLFLSLAGLLSLENYCGFSEECLTSNLFAYSRNFEESEQEDYERIDRLEAGLAKIGSGSSDDEDENHHQHTIASPQGKAPVISTDFLCAHRNHEVTCRYSQYVNELNNSIKPPKVYSVNCSLKLFS